MATTNGTFGGSLLGQAEVSRTLTPEAVGSQMAIMAAIAGAALLAFIALRPQHKIIYEPRVKYHTGGKAPPKISSSVFGWIPPLLRTKEPEILEKCGLDAVIFLRFLRMFRNMFGCIAILSCAILIPINISYNLNPANNVQNTDVLSILTLAALTQSNLLYIHVGVTYVITFLCMGFIYFNWRAVVRLRQEWFRSPEYKDHFFARTLMVTDVPKKLQSDEGVRAVFVSMQVPYPTTSVTIARHVGQLPELIEEHNQTVKELEAVLVRYLKDGKVGNKRPTMRIGAFWGMGGTKVDSIDFYTEKLRRSEAAVDAYRQKIDLRKAENYGFASMAAVPYAHIVGNMLHQKRPKGTYIDLAPNPRDIIWKNLNMSATETGRKRMTGFLLLLLVFFLNTIPLFAISILANLASFSNTVGFLKTWSTKSYTTFSIASGVLPPVVSGIFAYFLPIIVRKLSKYSGASTRSHLDRVVVARYFTFLVISQLIIFTLIGVGIKLVTIFISDVQKHKSAGEIINDFKNFPGQVVSTYIAQSSYWLAYFPLRGFLVVFDLSSIVSFIWISFRTHMFGRTPREIKEYTKPTPFEYAIYYSNYLFMGAVALVFAPLAPLITVAATIVLWLGSWVYKYQLLFVYTTKVESGGRMWNVVINRVLFSLILMNLFMVLTTFLQSGLKTFLWISSCPPLLIVVAYKIYLDRAFYKQFRFYVPTEEEIRTAKIHSDRSDNSQNKLQSRFGHPSLHAELYTPLLHQSMMPLLAQVYEGTISREKTKLQEYGGQKTVAQNVAGIRIAGIDQNDLEYDPRLYARDRGELDWDQRTYGTAGYYSQDGSSFMEPNPSYGFPDRKGSPTPSSLYQYSRDKALPSSQHHQFESGSEIDLSRMHGRDESNDQYPLLNSHVYQYPPQPQNVYSQRPPHLASPPGMTPDERYSPQISPEVHPSRSPYAAQSGYPFPNTYQAQESSGYYEAPLHRGTPTPTGYRSGTPQQRPSPGGYASPTEGNMAGRGAHRT